MKQEHKDYLEEHIANWHTVENGYVRNLDIQLLNMYEHIYRQYLVILRLCFVMFDMQW